MALNPYLSLITGDVANTGGFDEDGYSDDDHDLSEALLGEICGENRVRMPGERADTGGFDLTDILNPVQGVSKLIMGGVHPTTAAKAMNLATAKVAQNPHVQAAGLAHGINVKGLVKPAAAAAVQKKPGIMVTKPGAFKLPAAMIAAKQTQLGLSGTASQKEAAREAAAGIDPKSFAAQQAAAALSKESKTMPAMSHEKLDLASSIANMPGEILTLPDLFASVRLGQIAELSVTITAGATITGQTMPVSKDGFIMKWAVNEAAIEAEIGSLTYQQDPYVVFDFESLGQWTPNAANPRPIEWIMVTAPNVFKFNLRNQTGSDIKLLYVMWGITSKNASSILSNPSVVKTLYAQEPRIFGEVMARWGNSH